MQKFSKSQLAGIPNTVCCKTFYVVGLLVLLGFDLSGVYLLVLIGKVVKTLGLIFVVMNRNDNQNRNEEQTINLFSCCCITGLWISIIAIVVFLAILITDREKDHVDPQNLDPLKNITN